MGLFESSDLFASLLFGWTAECATNCLVPGLQLGSLDVISTLLNVTGAFLSGVASGAAQRHASSAALARLVPCFQNGFVGVWTSFAFMAEHSAEISYDTPTRFRRGVTYVLSTVACGLAGNWAGVRLGRDYLGAAILRLATSQWLPRAMVALVIGCVTRAFLSLTGLAIFPRGFVSDPTNPQFVGMKELQVRKPTAASPAQPSQPASQLLACLRITWSQLSSTRKAS
jgi:fluoride ion exporter CrcB/FEX